jgi:hypothetical protein
VESTTPPVVEQKDEIEPLTDEDIAAMPPGVRKQLDKSLGDTASVLDSGEMESDIEETEAKILQFVNKEKETDESQYATLVVVLPTGRSFTTSIPLLNVWDLLNTVVWSE